MGTQGVLLPTLSLECPRALVWAPQQLLRLMATAKPMPTQGCFAPAEAKTSPGLGGLQEH